MEQLESVLSSIVIRFSDSNAVTVGDIAGVLTLVVFTFLFVRFINSALTKWFEKSHLRPEMILTIRRILFYIVFLLVGLTVLAILGIPITVFAFATGALALGIGFGAQNIINNFISGWILIAERPIRQGDFIEIEGALGTVQAVGTRSTRIHRTDGVHMLVPNSKLLENTVVNWTLVDAKVRTTVRVGVAYDSNPSQVESVLREIICTNTVILEVPAPEIIFEDFGDSALIFDCFFWCEVNRERSLRAIRSDIRYEIAKRFASEGILIAYPQRDLHLHTHQPIEVSMSSQGSSRDG